MTSLVAHAPECTRSHSLAPADRGWTRAGARFRTSTGRVISLPADYTPGAREMYCRNVYLRTGLTMPVSGWVIDLGANMGLFSIWAAANGARVLAVEAQHGYAVDIRRLAVYNGVAERVHVEIAMAGGAVSSATSVGFLSDDRRWATTSHAGPTLPPSVTVPQLMSSYGIERIDMLKVDIEGGEFAVLAGDEDLSWLQRVDQLALEVHPSFGDAKSLIEGLHAAASKSTSATTTAAAPTYSPIASNTPIADDHVD